MLLYADEDFPFPVVERLRQIGHDVVTALDDGQRSQPDTVILARAHSLKRTLLTHNRRHFERLHRGNEPHSGVISTTQDSDHDSLAARIDAAVQGLPPGRWCLRVNKPHPGRKKQSP